MTRLRLKESLIWRKKSVRTSKKDKINGKMYEVEIIDYIIEIGGEQMAQSYRGRPRGRHALNVNKEHVEQLRGKGMSYKAIAKYLGCSRLTIYRRLRE